MNTVKFILAIIAITISNSLWAYDFYAVNDGDTIYYNITSDTLPYTVEVTYKALYDSTSYSGAISIPSLVNYDTKTYVVTRIGDCAFLKNKNLTSIILSDSILNIGMSAFRNCLFLTAITFSNFLETIESSAFYGCDALLSINIPASLKSIGEEVFVYCDKIQSITVDANSLYFKSMDDILYDYDVKNLILCASAKTGTVIVPNTVSCINDYAFLLCRGLTSIIFPLSLKTIGKFALAFCTGLTHLTIPDSVTTIGLGALTLDTNITTVNFNAINCNAPLLFGRDNKLKNIIFGDCVNTIPVGLCVMCEFLTSVSFPNSVRVIGMGAFSSCTGLTSIDIPDSVIVIGDGAFSDCSNLRSITIGVSIDSIGSYVFKNYKALKEITIKAETPPYIHEFTFFGGSPYFNIYVPCGSVDLYRSATNWSFYQNIIGLMPYDLQITPNDPVMGSIRYIQKQCENDTVIVQAMAKPNYHFVCWNDNITDNPRTLLLFQDTALTAIFAIDTHKLTVLSNDTNRGSVSGSGFYTHYDSVVITATPKSKYEFVKWSDNNTNNPRTLYITQDMVITAVFALKNSIKENQKDESINIYPNPVQDILYIDNGEQIINKVEIYDISGKLIKCIPVNNTKMMLPMDDLCKGIYFLSVYTMQTKEVRKIRKE